MTEAWLSSGCTERCNDFFSDHHELPADPPTTGKHTQLHAARQPTASCLCVLFAWSNGRELLLGFEPLPVFLIFVSRALWRNLGIQLFDD